MRWSWRGLGRRWVPYTIAVCSGVVLYLTLAHITDILRVLHGVFTFFTPVLWGLVIAYLIDALVIFYQRTILRRAKRKRAARRVAIVFAIVTILLLVTLLINALIPQIVTSVSVLASNLGYYVASLRRLLSSTDIEIAGYQLDLTNLVEYMDTFLQSLTTTLQENIGRIINTSFTIGKGFLNGVLSFILAIYFLLDKEKLQVNIKRLMRLVVTEERYRQIASFARRCNTILSRYITVDLLDGLLVGVVNFIFMKAMGMPYAVLISVVVGVANLVPTFGPIAGATVGAFILLLVNPRHVLWFLVFTIILQLVDGYILKPKFYGDSQGVSPLWVLVTIIVGGRMFGVGGILLAVPFAAISDYLFRNLVWKRLERRRAERRAAPKASPPPDAPAETDRPEASADSRPEPSDDNQPDDYCI